MYTPHTADEWKHAIKLEMSQFKRSNIFGAVRVEMEFYFTRPKNHFGTGRNSDKMKDSAPMFHVTKPDCDNLEKAVFDAISKTGLWKDDSYVVEAEPKKRYCLTGQEPGMRIRIIELEE